MTKKKKKYFPNKWKQYNEVPEEMFEPIEFDIFMDWKIGGYEIPQSVTALIREKDVETGKVKEHVYKYRHAARNKTRKLISEGNKEITIVQQDSVHFIDPRYNDIFDDY
tara:strand:- start:1600 stop:1926 length:327 start_codon:yes stop_codon:yes gene_type:complete